MKKLLILLLLVSNTVLAQPICTVKGRLPQLANTPITVLGYNGFAKNTLATTITDNIGNFSFSYPSSYVGAALLQALQGTNLILLLNKENFSVVWNNVKDIKTITYTQSPENEALVAGMIAGQNMDMKLAGLKFLLPLYQNSLDKFKWLNDEIAVQTGAYANFLEALPASSYAKGYIKLQKLVQDMLQPANRNTENLHQYEASFTSIDFNADHLWHSGLLPQLLEGIYTQMENYDSEAKNTLQSNAISNTWIKNLTGNGAKQQEVAEYCFKFLEKRNRSKQAEHIALSLLNQTNCILDAKRTNLFEQYRKMAIGNTAPNIALNNASLKQLNATYKLVVFGASWCSSCNTDYPSLVGKYKQLKQKFNTNVVYVSVDTSKQAYEAYYKEAPFTTLFDGKGWQTQAAKDYCVFATPTYILLDNDLKIIAKPKSPEDLIQYLLTNIKS